MIEIQLKAFAKINLALDVTGKRSDGYHNVRMIMQNIGLHDNLILTRRNSEGITLKTNMRWLPNDRRNLVYRAVEMIKEEFHITQGVHITLEKKIPVAAGMAGGSTDCAAALRGMNQLFGLNLSQEQLMERGVRLGADVPYCIMGGTALAEGIGEVLTPLKQPPFCYILIAKPDIGVSTKFVYENLKLGENLIHPDIDGMRKAIEQQDLEIICKKMGNILETVTINKYPVINSIKEEMMDCGAINALMSGSGPTVFGIYGAEGKAREAMKRLKGNKETAQVFLTTPEN